MPTREFDKDFKKLLEDDLYLFSKFGLEYNQKSYLQLSFHYVISLFLSLVSLIRKQLELPRSFLKTTLAVENRSIWLAVKDPDWTRVLIRCDVVDNAIKSIRRIKSIFENSEMLQRLWPKVIPDFSDKKTKWSDKAAQLNRKTNWPEATFQAAGRGTKLVRQHFTNYVEDDLLIPKKDDLTGNEMIPSRDDVEKAIGAHKLAEPLLVNPTCEIVNVQNRWSEWDLVRHIIDNEPWYVRYHGASVKEPDKWPDSEPTYPSRFPIEILKGVEMRAGSYVFSTQYLGKPYDIERMAFRLEWLKTYEECPENVNTYIVCDPSFGQTKYADYSVVMVVSLGGYRDIYVRHYVRGRFDLKDFINYITTFYHDETWNPIAVGLEKYHIEKALSLYMEEEPDVRIIPVKRNQGESKDLHIRSLIPLCRDGRLYIKDDMHELRTEFVEYPSGKSNDLLDALADVLRIASFPMQPKPKPERGPFQLETILEELRNKRKGGLPFDYQLSPDLEEEIKEVI